MTTVQLIFRPKILIVFLFCLVCVMLFFGLRPKGLSFKNQVKWSGSGNGLEIGKYGIAFAVLKETVNAVDELRGFSIELAIRPSTTTSRRFMSILSIHTGSDKNQLMIGQWQSSIIAMNGDDYDNSKRTPKIIAKDILNTGETHLISLGSSIDEGTRIFCDGTLVASSRDLSLNLPKGEGSQSYLVIGNSVYNHQYWNGLISGFALYRHQLSAADITFHSIAWSKDGNFGYALMADPSILYLFNEKQGYVSKDFATGKYPLIVPPKVTALKREFLSYNSDKLEFKSSTVVDIFLNFFGFIPLGFVLVAFLSHYSRLGYFGCGFISTGFCSFLSLFIETIQVWMPSRSSSLLDFLLNTLGGLAGVLLLYVLGLSISPYAYSACSAVD